MTLAEMDRLAMKLGVAPAERALHPLMLMGAEVDAHIAVQNRIIKVGIGDRAGFCDAPTLVVVSFGIVGRNVYLLREAAHQPCVRHALLDHYTEHSRLLDNEVQRFVEQKQENIGSRMHRLSQTPASDEGSAGRAFETALWPIVKEVIQQFKVQMEESRQREIYGIDSNERLEQLRDACGGKVREMEQELTRQPTEKAQCDDLHHPHDKPKTPGWVITSSSFISADNRLLASGSWHPHHLAMAKGEEKWVGSSGDREPVSQRMLADWREILNRCLRVCGVIGYQAEDEIS